MEKTGPEPHSIRISIKTPQKKDAEENYGNMGSLVVLRGKLPKLRDRRRTSSTG